MWEGATNRLQSLEPATTFQMIMGYEPTGRRVRVLSMGGWGCQLYAKRVLVPKWKRVREGGVYCSMLPWKNASPGSYSASEAQ